MPPRNKGFAKPKNAKKTIGRIIQYMGKFKALWLVVFLCVIISSGASVIGTYLIKPALNNTFFWRTMATESRRTVKSYLRTSSPPIFTVPRNAS